MSKRLPQLQAGQLEQGLADQAGEGPGEHEEDHLHGHVARPRLAVDPGFRKEAAEEIGDRVLLRQGDHVGWRALQHGDVGGLVGQRRHQGHGGRAATDHHHLLAAVVEVLGPQLRMDDLPGEVLATDEFRGIAGLVAVVAGAHQQELRGHAQRLGLVAALHVEVPARIGGIPVGPEHPVAVADLPVDAVLPCGLLDVAADRRTVGDGLRIAPWLEVVAEGEHVRVGTDAGVAEQVPGTAHRRAPFEQGEALAGAMLHQVVGGADAGQSGADDEYVQVFDRHKVPRSAEASSRLLG